MHKPTNSTVCQPPQTHYAPT